MPLALHMNDCDDFGARAVVIRAHLPTEEDLPGNPKPKQPPPLPDGEVPPPAPLGDPPSEAPPERAFTRRAWAQ
ncbi:hypothetical protein [Paraburkholderia bannensis]|uniref:hypothetical protein n=1 Tax=Paraburkholderia bannensis TaxID=765414 RepID=UPI002AB28685|nr:hypothetical protein [Paraburkholderia bannensis]